MLKPCSFQIVTPLTVQTLQRLHTGLPTCVLWGLMDNKHCACDALSHTTTKNITGNDNMLLLSLTFNVSQELLVSMHHHQPLQRIFQWPILLLPAGGSHVKDLVQTQQAQTMSYSAPNVASYTVQVLLGHKGKSIAAKRFFAAVAAQRCSQEHMTVMLQCTTQHANFC